VELARQKIGLLGAEYSHGAAVRGRGSEHAPNAIRQTNVFEELKKDGVDISDYGNVSGFHYDPYDPASSIADNDERSVQEIAAEMIQAVHKRASNIIKDKRMPFIIGGDHSISTGSILAAKEANENMGLIWIDAHNDLGTLGHLEPWQWQMYKMHLNIRHGNVLAILSNVDPTAIIKKTTLGKNDFIPRSKVCIVGRNSSFGKHNGYAYMTDADIDQAIDIASDGGKNKIYTSFDIDVLDGEVAPGTGFPIGAMSLEQAKAICSKISNSGLLVGADLVEVNPGLDEKGKTIMAAKQIISSTILGK